MRAERDARGLARKRWETVQSQAEANKKKQVAKNKCAQAQTKTEESLEELFSISI